MAVPSMRHTKLKASEAAMLAGELKKPSWESKNEGIHERVSFEDTIWGFDLAGGSYYKTPLRVTRVKEGSRAEKAGIRPGDKLKRINDIDTSTLTIQEAHEIIVESGIHLRIAVTAPEDEEDSYNVYEDSLLSQYDPEEDRRRELEKYNKSRVIHYKTSSYWSLMWPWVSKRRIMYRESNCFLVPSKFETNHGDKLLPLPSDKKPEDNIELHSKKSEQELLKEKSEQKITEQVNGETETNNKVKDELPNNNIPDSTTTNGQSGLAQNSAEYHEAIEDYIDSSSMEESRDELAVTDSTDNTVQNDMETTNMEESKDGTVFSENKSEDTIDVGIDKSSIEIHEESIEATDEENEDYSHLEESNQEVVTDTEKECNEDKLDHVNTDDEIIDKDTSKDMSSDDEGSLLNEVVSDSEPLSAVTDSR